MIATAEDLERVRQECRGMVRRRAGAAGALAAIPTPGVDIAGDIAMLLELIPAINRRFQLDVAQIEQLDSTRKLIVYRLVRRIGARFIGGAVTVSLVTNGLARFGVQLAAESIAKYVPIIGTLASATIAYQVFKTIAYGHIEDCTRIAKGLIEGTAEEAGEETAIDDPIVEESSVSAAGGGKDSTERRGSQR